MEETLYKGFFIVAEFNEKFDIRNTMGLLETEGLNSVKECKELIDTWI